jgi:hypothetical protein
MSAPQCTNTQVYSRARTTNMVPMIQQSFTLPLLPGAWMKQGSIKFSSHHFTTGTAKHTGIPFDFKGPLEVQYGPKLIPWLRASEQLDDEQNALRKLPLPSLAPKAMDESYYSFILPFSTDEVRPPEFCSDDSVSARPIH